MMIITMYILFNNNIDNDNRESCNYDKSICFTRIIPILKIIYYAEHSERCKLYIIFEKIDIKNNGLKYDTEKEFFRKINHSNFFKQLDFSQDKLCTGCVFQPLEKLDCLKFVEKNIEDNLKSRNKTCKFDRLIKGYTTRSQKYSERGYRGAKNFRMRNPE